MSEKAPSGRPLAGRRIGLTRALAQAAPWAAALEAAGARVQIEPLLAIEPPADTAAAERGLAELAAADIVIATSVNAVDGACRLGPPPAWPANLLAIGAATAAALEAASGQAVARPAAGFSSEAVLDLEVLQAVAGRRVVLLAGEGGREQLAETLTDRGASVTKLALYRRAWLDPGRERLSRLVCDNDAIVVASGETLAHLLDLVEASGDARLAAGLMATRLVAPSSRVVQHSDQRLEWTHPPVIVERIGGETIVGALARVWRGDRQ